MTTRLLGCNTLYPFGRLDNPQTQFGLEAHRRALEILRDAGFDGCEFSHYSHLSAGECRQVNSMCTDLGLIPWSAHAWVPLPARVEQTAGAVSQLTACLRGAAALGVSVMVVHAAKVPAEADRAARQARTDTLQDTLRQLGPVAVDLGLTMAIENCGDWTDTEQIVDAVEASDPPGVGFNVDTGHAVLWGMSPAAVIRLMGARLATTHLQDNFGERDDHLPPGKGSSIDWTRTLQALHEAGYEGMLMVELSDRPPGRDPDPMSDTRAASSFLRKRLAAMSAGGNPQ